MHSSRATGPRTASLDPEAKRQLAAKVQERVLAIGALGTLGQFYEPVAFRDNLKGITSPIQFYWTLARDYDLVGSDRSKARTRVWRASSTTRTWDTDQQQQHVASMNLPGFPGQVFSWTVTAAERNFPQCKRGRE